jgi:butyrate kinase
MKTPRNETILVINPGSTSTKVAIFDADKERLREAIEHPMEELAKHAKLYDQLPMRSAAVRSFLAKAGVEAAELDCIVARGGLLPPVKSGAYHVDAVLLDTLRARPAQLHASNLAAMIADEIGGPLGLASYIYDSVAVDELDDLARYSGAKELPRVSFSHVLNTRAMCLKYAAGKGARYKDLNLIAAHLGGGVSVNAHRQGQIVDVVTAEDGPFSTERAGSLPTLQLIDLVRREGADSVLALERGKGGLVSYLGTNSAIEAGRRIDSGDREAELVLHAMAYQVAKAIGEMATVLKGAVDAIIITGGMANSARLVAWITERVDFIAPVAVLPGENEMQALAEGALRVLRGEERARHMGED